MTETAAAELTEQQRAVLDFEEKHQVWKYQGAKESTIRDELDISLVRYLQILGYLVKQPAALAYKPTVVRRLDRLRVRREHQRSSARLRRIRAGDPTALPDDGHEQSLI